ncbi:MAG: hypothetical protein ACTH2Y_08460 [Corynebacterium sp.]|uniref:hypothetical protein n=1 Tax=Corynebacterium sp. TaxID=1720 RepID=UPI003F9362BA
MSAHNKTPTAGQGDEGKSSKFHEAQTTDTTPPALAAWNQAVGGHTIPAPPTLAEQRWGEGYVDAPDWVVGSTTDGEVVSDPITLSAEHYNRRVTNSSGVGYLSKGISYMHIVQAVNGYVPRVNISVHRPGVRAIASTQIDSSHGLDLLPHEIQPLIEALSVARDLIADGGDQ